MDKALLVADHVGKIFEVGGIRTIVFSDLSIIFEQGRSYAITGISGAGKSTFMHILACLDVPTTGDIIFNGIPFRTFTSEKRSFFLSHSIGLVFQMPHLIRELSVLENVALPCLIAHQDKKECYGQAADLLRHVGLSAKEHSKPGELSGGQQQRVAVARALMNNPAFLIADEPTGHLDKKTGQSIIELLNSCCHERGMGLIVSSHDAYVTDAMQQVHELVDGALIRR